MAQNHARAYLEHVLNSVPIVFMKTENEMEFKEHWRITQAIPSIGKNCSKFLTNYLTENS